MNRITLYFQECSPAPSMGYMIEWRVAGSSDPYTVVPGAFFTSPAVFTDGTNPDGTQYEGLIRSVCRGSYGNPIAWSTEESEASGSQPATPCKTITLHATSGFPTVHYRTCAGVIVDGYPIPIGGTTICTDGTGITISGGGVSIDSEVEGDCDSDFAYYLADEYACGDCGGSPTQTDILIRLPLSHVVQIGKFYRPVGHPTGFVYTLNSDVGQPPASSIELTTANFNTCNLACS